MTERTWQKGPPPHVGWWNASAYRRNDTWRWWDGRRWSIAVTDKVHPQVLNGHTVLVSGDASIEWSDYWPENARVPRLDPTDGHWTFNTDGKQPDFDERVEVIFRNGRKNHWYCVENWLWNITGEVDDIVAWRPAK